MLGALGKLGAVGQVPLPRRVRNILSKYQATALIPGSNGVAVHSFAPGNYIESTAKTLSPVDGDVGLVVDAAGSPGPELVVNGGFDSADGWELAANSTATAPVILGGVVSFNSQSTDYVWCRRNLAAALTVGKTYEVSVECKTFASGNFQLVLLGGTSTVPITGITGVGSRRAIFTATAAHTSVEISRTFGSSSYVASFDNLTVRELPGIHATQPTTQYKPKVRRGLVNELLWSNNFSKEVWGIAPGFSAVSEIVTGHPQIDRAYKVTSVSGNQATAGSFYPATSTSMTAAFVVKAGTHNPALLIRNATTSTVLLQITAASLYNSSSNGTATNTDIGGGWRLVVINITSGISVGNNLHVYVGATAQVPVGKFWYLHSAALFQGTVTAEEILAAGGIPVTTSAPASSAIGPQYWKFDGTDDRLQLSAVPFQMSDDHWVVAGCRTVDKVTGRAIASVSGTTQCRIAQILISNTGSPTVLWRDDAGVAVELARSIDVTNISVVVSAVKRASLLIGRSDGSVFQTSALPSFGACTPISAGVGANTAISVAPHNGAIHGVIFGKGAISDSELLTLERFAAKLQGRTL